MQCAGVLGCNYLRGPQSALTVLSAISCPHNIHILCQASALVWSEAIYTLYSVLRVKVPLVLIYVKQHLKTEPYCVNKQPAHCHPENSRSEGEAPPKNSENTNFHNIPLANVVQVAEL